MPNFSEFFNKCFILIFLNYVYILKCTLHRRVPRIQFVSSKLYVTVSLMKSPQSIKHKTAEKLVHVSRSHLILLLSSFSDQIFYNTAIVRVYFAGDGDMENSIVLEPNQTIENRGDKSYLIVWQVSQT